VLHEAFADISAESGQEMFVTKVLFAMVAAVAAAAIVDPVVEGLSNVGLFGSGTYTDGSNADVIVVLTIAGLIAAIFVALMVQRMLRGTAAPSRWLRVSSTQLGSAGIAGLLPAIFVLQLGVLYAMETLEQTLVVGHAFGGTVWMGAPVLASLLLHGVGCIIVSFGLARLLQVLARRIVEVVRFALRCWLLQRNVGPLRKPRAAPIVISRLLEPLIERLLGRAPPLPSV
jgi:hypothetical protein